MRISCQTRHIICFVINLIIYLIINRNIYIYIYIVICICAMSSSAPENIKSWCANGHTNRRFVWKQRQVPIALNSSGVNPPTAPGGARASAGQPFLFLLFHHKFRKPDFSGLQTEGYRASVAWEARRSCCACETWCVCYCIRGDTDMCLFVCGVSFCGAGGVRKVFWAVTWCMCCVMHVLVHFFVERERERERERESDIVLICFGFCLFFISYNII